MHSHAHPAHLSARLHTHLCVHVCPHAMPVSPCHANVPLPCPCAFAMPMSLCHARTPLAAPGVFPNLHEQCSGVPVPKLVGDRQSGNLQPLAHGQKCGAETEPRPAACPWMSVTATSLWGSACPVAWGWPCSQQSCRKAGCPSVGVAVAQPSHRVCSQSLSNSTSERAGSSHTEETMGGTARHSPEDCRFLDVSSWLALPPRVPTVPGMSDTCVSSSLPEPSARPGYQWFVLK